MNATRSKRPAKKSTKAAGPPRDFRGYGAHPPHAQWPGGARIASTSISTSKPGAGSLLEGDAASEGMLTDIGFPPYAGVRSPMVESVFEYGPRVGAWRLLRIFRRFDIKVSILGVVRGLQQCPELTQAFIEDGHEIVSHGWRWLDYHQMSEPEEREHIARAAAGIKALTGKSPAGWFNGRPSINTRRLVIEHGGFLYDRDYLGDELPFWVSHGGRHHLVIPFSFETNDNRFDQNSGFSTADDFATYLTDCFDLLYEEGGGNSESDEHLAARSSDRPAGQGGWPDQISRPCAQARPRLVRHRQGHRGALAEGASAGRRRIRARVAQRRDHPKGGGGACGADACCEADAPSTTLLAQGGPPSPLHGAG